MIPYSLQFSGIRDYKPVKLTFGEDGEHILISGPNGAGKSTITFAIGAVLYSAKVDIEGLRSANLRSGQTWNAEVFLTFHNTGVSKIDGAPFIAFQLLIKQEPNEVIQRQFKIYTGDSPDALKQIATYRSGDHFSNLSMYRDDLIYKYKIHPDMFYLIWYQKEVNQFATMTPEERFRRFSEMYHIEEIQKEWEISVEHLKDLEAELQVTKSNIKLIETQMKIAYEAYNRFKSNERSLRIHGKNHVWLTLSIKAKLEQELKNLELEFQKTQQQLQGLQNKSTVILNQISELKERKKQKEQQSHQLDKAIRQLKHKELTLHNQHVRLKAEIEHLNKKLENTQELRKKIQFSEEDARKLVVENTVKMEELKKELELYKYKIIENSRRIEEWQYKKIKEEFALDMIIAQEDDFKKLLSIYTSSYHVEKSLQQNKQAYNHLAKKIPLAEEKCGQLKLEITMLQQNKIMSIRQKEAIQHLKKQEIQAYTLRDFVELEASATLKDEKRIDPIKYTIFYKARSCEPANDLYHVALSGIVPTKFLNHLPQLKLKIRDQLSEEEIILATKVLYWIEQFFEKQPRLEQGGLIDERGIRGPQEKDSFILSSQAVEKRLIQLQKDLSDTEKQLQEDIQSNAEYEQQINSLQSVIKDVKKAEAFLLEMDKKSEHLKLIQQLQEKISDVQQENLNLQEQLIEIQAQQAMEQLQKQVLQEQLEVYKKLGELKAEQQKLLQYEKEEKQLIHNIRDNEKTKREKQLRFDDIQDLLNTLSRNIGRLVNDKENNEHAIQHIDKKQMEINDQILTIKAEITRNEIILKDLEIVISELFEEALQEQVVQDESMSSLLSQNEQSKIAFETARNAEVDPHAEENYKIRKSEYDKKQLDIWKIEERLEEVKDLVLENENKLETTINTHVSKLNNRFQQYMGQFNFESEISWERFENHRGQVIFKLYVKVHKDGHGSKLEDVSIKARNGKHGRGVSGGEESLSSLLFALALLQHLETTPGYIILDEFDSALDEIRKEKVFELYATELQRKLIILSPKAHDNQYYANYSKVFIVQHDPTKVESTIKGIQMKNKKETLEI